MKEQTKLRDDKGPKMYNEEVCIIKKMKQSKRSYIEARSKDELTYVKPYIKKNDGRTDIKSLRSRYENVATKEQYVSKIKRTIETIQYINKRATTFKCFSASSSKLSMN